MPTKTVLDELRSTPGAGSLNKLLAWSGLGIVFIVGLVLLPRIVETNDAGMITIRQKAITGTLTAFVEEVTFLQLLGDVT